MKLMQLTQHVTISICLAASTLGCAALDWPQLEPAETAAKVEPKPAPPAVLYARDGSVVASEPREKAAQPEDPKHELSSHDGSRVYLLELYQKAMDEKDALVLEVKSLNAQMVREVSEHATTTKERDALALRDQAATVELEKLKNENFDLQARLVTAQIRRLEAEKMLLENLIQQRAAESEASKPAEKAKEKPADKAKPVTSDARGAGGHP
jgi:hypothetical protein